MNHSVQLIYSISFLCLYEVVLGTMMITNKYFYVQVDVSHTENSSHTKCNNESFYIQYNRILVTFMQPAQKHDQW